jgi:hypothetical protein
MKRWWTVLKTTLFHLKWLFFIWPLNFWHNNWVPNQEKSLFFLNVTPGLNCNWTPKV